MKGYSPILSDFDKTKEVSSKIKQVFIELGVVNIEQNEEFEEVEIDIT